MRIRVAAFGAVVIAVALTGCTSTPASAPTSSSTTITVTIDSALAAQCNALGTALSDLVTADNGLSQGDITPAQAQALMAQAAQAVHGVPASGSAGQELTALRTWLYENPTADPRTEPVPQTANTACDANGTPIVIVSQYGG